MRYAKLYPPSKAAGRWSESLGADFHDVFLTTDIYTLNLLFSDLQVTDVTDGAVRSEHQAGR
ncbi:hypothetical protein MRBLMG1_003834 [Streptomyces sp. LMG1-1-1.1]